MSRETCYRCFWPQSLCWCPSITPITTRTKFVFLMHPYEFKRVKAATGRLTHLCLADSAIHVGVGFDENEEVQGLIRDPKNFCVLLYPTRDARDLSKGELHAADFQGRRLVVFLLEDRRILLRSPPRILSARVLASPGACDRQAGLLVSKGDFEEGREA